MSSARARLQPPDIALRHHRAYQWTRRAVLAASVGLTVALPLWHLERLGTPPPPALGMPGAFGLLGLELVDPLAVLGVLIARGPGWGLLWAALPGLVLVAVLGRFFCGWLCPYVPLIAASNAARWGLTRLGLRLPDVRLPRTTAAVALVGVLAASALLGVQVLPLVYPPSILGREAFRLVFFGGLSSGALVVAAAFAFDTFISRAGFCRTLCPGGAMFSALSVASPVRVIRTPAQCTDCTVCDVVCNLGQKPMTDQLDPGCERCGKCIAACPKDALRFGRLERTVHNHRR